MILVGSQRGNVMKLARHLLNTRENDHVELHELRGFVADDVAGAFKEVQAVARGTRCEQPLFSLSLSPPETEFVTKEAFEAAIEEIEQKLGLAGQPRAVIFHEKKGRRHAHAVWSRIDATRMRSINLPHYKRKLNDIARTLYLEHGWQMPAGFVDHEQRDPLNFEQAESQQAKRAKQDPQSLKRLFRNCWEQSDSLAAFAAALREHGLILAKGNRRGFVAVDRQGEIYAISRWVGIKAREVRAKLGSADNLPSVEQAIQQFAQVETPEQQDTAEQLDTRFKTKIAELEAKRRAMFTAQRNAREALRTRHEQQRHELIQQNLAALPTGIKAIWTRISGGYQAQLAANELSLADQKNSQRIEMQSLVQNQLQERRALEQQFKRVRADYDFALDQLDRDIGEELHDQEHVLKLDPRQPLIIPPSDDEKLIAARIRQNPEVALEVINDKKETFTRNDIARTLNKYIDDPSDYATALSAVMQSSELVRLQDGSHYTTREFLETKNNLQSAVSTMVGMHTHGVRQEISNAAIKRQNAKLQGTVGATLSDEQTDAIRHVLQSNQFSVIVGLAGAGKSTMLDAAREAWEYQSYHVIGAALAGKAADGLEQSSGIKSRTLASLEYSIKNAHNPLATNTVLVIDEAGMVGTRQLARVCDTAKKAGSKVVLVGDPAQLQPIKAGSPFGDIVETQPHVRLTEIRRQKDQWQRDAVHDLAAGRINEAMAAFDAEGCINRSSSYSEAIAKLVHDYVADVEEHGESKSRLALAFRRKDVHAINQGIRAELKKCGYLADEVYIQTDHGPRAFAAGDRIVFTKNDNDLCLRNGMLATIEAITADKITVRLDGSPSQRVATIPTNHRTLDHGFASTVHKSQGQTADSCYIFDSGLIDIHVSYVALSRHRANTRIYSICRNFNMLPSLKWQSSRERKAAHVAKW